MGAGQSKADQDEQVILNETPIQFSQDVVNHLADQSAKPGPSPERQSSIDAHISSRIHAELSRLQQEEQEVRREIELSLEKENLDYELNASNVEPAASGEDSQKTLNSTVLLDDLEEVRAKVDKFHSKQESAEQQNAVRSANALSSCYANKASKPLECWQEVAAFRSSVARIEQDYIASFR